MATQQSLRLRRLWKQVMRISRDSRAPLLMAPASRCATSIRQLVTEEAKIVACHNPPAPYLRNPAPPDLAVMLRRERGAILLALDPCALRLPWLPAPRYSSGSVWPGPESS